MHKNATPDELFSHNPKLLNTAFELWQSGRYATYKKALFFSTDIDSEQEAKVLLEKALAYEFHPDTIQSLGALRAIDGTMFYNESFLNMIQRIDFQKFKLSLHASAIKEKPICSFHGTLVSIALLKQILKTWLYDVRIEFIE
jgi:hypothetical protein